MHKGQAVIGTFGGAMFATFLTTAQMHFFSTPAHPRLVFWLMVVSGMAWVFCGLVWLRFHFGVQSSSPLSQSIDTGGGDNSGSQYNAGEDINDSGTKIGGSVIGTDALREIMRSKTPVVAAKKPACPTLQLSLVTHRTVIAIDGYQVDWGDEGDERCLAIAVMNKPGDHGECAPDARSIVARITLGDITIERACWIGKDQNEITLEGGDTAHVLVGIPRKKLSWTLFNNPNQNKFYYGDFGGGFRGTLEEQVLSLSKASQVAGEIIIVSKAPSTRGMTFAKKRFVLTENSTSDLFPIIADWWREK